MGLTERGKWTNNYFDERGKIIIKSLTETGRLVFGITGTPVNPTNPPVVTIWTVDRHKISNQLGIDRTVVTFQFDTDVSSWSVNVMGADQGTGIIADSGGAVTAGTIITATIDYSELYQEGYNKVNIYGQNGAGWTPFESDPNAPTSTRVLQLNGISDYIYTPSIPNITDVYMDVELNDDAGTLWNARNGNDKPEIQWDGTKFISTYGTSHFTTSETGSTDPVYNIAIPKNKKVTIHTWETTAWTQSTYNFGRTGWSNSNYLNMKVYSIKLCNGSTIVAHYDMSTGTVQDQSGNGNHATLNGGTWI